MAVDLVTLTLGVDSTQVKKAAKDLDQLGESGKKLETKLTQTTSAIDKLQAALDKLMKPLMILETLLMAMIAVEIVKYITTAADAFSSMEARIRLVTKSTADAKLAFQTIINLSRATGTSLDQNTNLFLQMSNSLNKLGKSQADILALTDTITKLGVLSGATAEEIGSSLRQLSQGFSSGVLRGDELNRIMENLPPLAAAIAKGMGKTVDQLRAMGAEGKLTSTAVADSLKKVGPEIEAQFKTLPVTVSRAWQALSDSFLVSIGRINQSLQGTAGLGSVILAVADSMDTLLKGTFALVGGLTAILIARTVAKAVDGMALASRGAAVGFAMMGRFGAIAQAQMVATTVAANLAAAATRGLSAALNLVGGPLGAIVLATMALGGLMAWLQRTKGGTAEQVEKLDDQTEAYLKSTGRIKENTTALAGNALAQAKNVAEKIKALEADRAILAAKIPDQPPNLYVPDLPGVPMENDAGAMTEYLKNTEALKTMDALLKQLKQQLMDTAGSVDPAFSVAKLSLEAMAKEIGMVYENGKLMSAGQSKLNEATKQLAPIFEGARKGLKGFGEMAAQATEILDRMQLKIDPVARGIKDMSDRAAALRIPEGFSRDLFLRQQELEKQQIEGGGGKLTTPQVADINTAFYKEKEEEAKVMIDLLRQETMWNETLRQARLKKDKSAIAIAENELEIIKAAKDLGPALDQNTLRTLKNGESQKDLAVEVQLASESLSIQASATRRLAEAAGLGEAATRAATAANSEAAARASNDGTLAAVQAKLREEEASKIIEIRNDTVRSLELEIANTNKESAAIAAGGEALRNYARDQYQVALVRQLGTDATKAGTAAQKALNDSMAAYDKRVASLDTKFLEEQKKAANDNIGMMQAELGLMNRAEPFRVRALANLKAQREAMAQFGTTTSAAAKEYIDLSMRQADTQIALDAAKAASAESLRIWTQAAEGIQDALTDAFRSAFDEGGFNAADFAKTLKKLMLDVASQIASALVFKPVMGSIVSSVAGEAAGYAFNPAGYAGNPASANQNFGSELGKTAMNQVQSYGAGQTGIAQTAGTWLNSTAAEYMPSIFTAVAPAASSAAAAGTAQAGLAAAGQAGTVISASQGVGSAVIAAPIGTAYTPAISSALTTANAPIAGSAAAGTGLTATGALGAAGIGFAAGSLIGGWAGNKTGSKVVGGAAGAASGAAAGAIAGSIIPGIGTLAGAIIGGIAGTLGGVLGTASLPSNKEGNATFDMATGDTQEGGQTGKKMSKENRNVASQMVNTYGGIGQLLGSFSDKRMTDKLKISVGDRDGLVASVGDVSTTFKRNEKGIEDMGKFIVQQFTKQIGSDLPDNLRKVMSKLDFKDLEQVVKDINFAGSFEDTLKALRGDFGFTDDAVKVAKEQIKNLTTQIIDFRAQTKRLGLDTEGANQATKEFVEGLIGLRDTAEPLTQIEVELAALKAQFEELPSLLKEVGIAAEEGARGQQRALDKIRSGWLDGIERQIAELTGNARFAWDDMVAVQKARLKDATLIGASIVEVERLNALERAKFLADLTDAQRKSLGALLDVAEQLSLTLAGVQSEILTTIETQIDLANDAAKTAKQSAATYRQLAKSMLDTIKSLRGGDLSTLSPKQKLDEKRALFEATAVKAQTGDETALSELSTVANDFLAASRGYNASSEAYVADFNRVMDILAGASVIATKQASLEERNVQLLERQVAVLELMKKSIETGDYAALTQQIAALNVISSLLIDTKAILYDQTGQIVGVTNQQTGALNQVTFDQTGEITSGNVTIEILKALQEKGITIDDKVLAAIQGTNASQASLVGAVVAGNERLAGLLGSFLQLTQWQRDEEKRRADEAARIAEAQAKAAQEAARIAAEEAARRAERDRQAANINATGTLAKNVTAAQIGGASNTEFIQRMFQQVAGRAATQGDIDWHNHILNINGNNRDRMLMYFKENPEIGNYLEALRNQVRALGGVPAFATGGLHSGGLRLVGERGPELEVTGPSRIFSARETERIIQGGNDNREIVIELRVGRQQQANDMAALRQDVQDLRADNTDLRQQLRRVVGGQGQSGSR